MAAETVRRKDEHLDISLSHNVQARCVTTGFEDVHLIHRALPEMDRNKILLSTTVFRHKFTSPLIVGAITGGTPRATRINTTIAQAVEQLGLGMGVGSQRAAIENRKLEKTFSTVRISAPNAFIMANIGAIQLANGFGLKEIRRAVDMIQADALAIHLNTLQESTQPEGQTNFEGILQRIKNIAGEVDVPVIVKETGAGIAFEEATKLEAAGAKGIDVSGVGGTSFAAVESYRADGKSASTQELGTAFWDWGIPTAVTTFEAASTVKIPVISSGGIRSGLDVAKALSLGASLASLSQPILVSAVRGVGATVNALARLVDEIRNTMFLCGARTVHSLQAVPVIVTGKTAEWLRLRGFDVEICARRHGANK